jgi:two-component system OmpR family sensor kinase
MSLRLKLTFLYSGVLAFILLSFGSLVYFFLERNLSVETDRSVAEIAQELIHSTKIVGPHSLRQVVLPNLDVFATPSTYIQVIDRYGTIVAQSVNLGRQSMPIHEETLNKAAAGAGFYETLLSGSQSLRIYNQPLILGQQVIGVLQVGRSLGPTYNALARLRFLLLFGGALTLFFTAILGWFLAGQALRPIDRITEAAAAIQQAQDLSRRIDYTGPRDEVGRLADTFNLMLERLHLAYRELEEAGEAQRRFVADASHELRTPLTTIRGNVELLKKMGDADPQTRAEALDDIAGEVERMSRLVTDLLALARADAGFTPALGPVDLGALLEEIYRQGSILAGEVAFTLEGHTALSGVLVNGNSDYLKQLFLILLDNAFNYTGPGGAVTLAGRLHGGWAEVVVRDSGSGIAQEDLPKIFDRFYRADKSRQASGTGLGLAIARWIVEQHSGSINVDSQPGEGSAFRVRLPLS